jgi:phage-related protein
VLLNDFTYNSITFGKLVRTSGYRAEFVNGSQVGIRDTITSMPGQDGVERYRSFYRDRLVEIRGFIIGSSESNLYTLKNTLEDAFDIHNLEAEGNDGFLPLEFTETGQNAARYYLKPIRNTMNISEKRTGFCLGFSVLLEARDPNKYETSSNVYTITPNISGGSSGFPVGFPVAFAGTNLSGDTTINNTGAAGTLPQRVSITGPCSAPKLANTTNGTYLEFTGDLTILTGESLIIDFGIGTCYKEETNGNMVNVIQYLTSLSTFWSLDKGDNNITLSAATMSEGCTANILINFTT